MCNYSEESSRPLSTMECQNAFDQLVSETEAAKAVDNSSPDAENPTDIAKQYQQFVKSLTPKQVADIEQEKLCEDHDKWLDEEDAMAKKASEIDALEKAADECGVDMTGMLDDMREAAGLSTEDGENIPTLTKETIDAATEAFLDEEDVDEVNEADCTDLCEEDAPDEGEEGKPNQFDENLAKLAKEVDRRLKDECDCDGNCIKCEYKCSRRQAKMQDELRIAEADEKSKQQAEKLTAKMEGKTGDWKADRQKVAHDAWNEFYEKWDRLPKDIQDTLAKVPGFMLSLNMYREGMKKKQMENLTDYDPEKTVNDLSKAHEQGNISAADAAKVMNEPTMISNFMWNNPGFNQWNQERFYYSSDNCAKISQQFEDLQKKGVIPPTNNGQYFSSKDQNGKMWFNEPSAALGNTLIMGMQPFMGDTVKDGNGYGKGDCTVADVWEQDVARVQKVNQSFKIAPDKKPLTPEESLAELMSDMPKAMVDKIMSIPNDDWRYTFDGCEFELSYAVASRRIRLIMSKRNLSATDHVGAVFRVEYINDGPGSVNYMRGFNTLKDITDAGKNAKRLYQWYGKVIAAFFGK